MRRDNPPSDLLTPGRALWRWARDEFDTHGTEPMLCELCRLADRLKVRESIRKQGVWIDGRKNPLVDIEIKLSGGFTKVWRTLGLADREDEPRRPVGRPPHSER